MREKYSFVNDYSEGAHPNILEALLRTNNEQAPDYGHDHFTEEAITLLYEFYVWAPVDSEHDAVRLVTSWTTPESAVDQFLEDVRTLMV